MKGAEGIGHAIRIGGLLVALAFTQIGQAQVPPTPPPIAPPTAPTAPTVPTTPTAAPTTAPTWTVLTPTGGPPHPRFLHTAVYDDITNRMIIFGGSDNISRVLNTVWVLTNADGLALPSTWTQLNPLGGPPAPRTSATAVYDPGSSSMIVFGGQPAAVCSGLNDVWVLSNATGLGLAPTWTQLSPLGTAPGPRRQHTAVYDGSTNRMIVFGGDPCTANPSNDVWMLSNANGRGGTPAWTQLATVGPGAPCASSATPCAFPARSAHSAVYDPISNRMIVFGGLLCDAPGCPLLNDVWALTNANGVGGVPVWTQLAVAGGPPPARMLHSATYDPATNSMTVFGGKTAAGTGLNDAWVLSNANGVGGTPTWTPLAVAAGAAPSARWGHTAVYRALTNRMTIFDGLNNPTGWALMDTWVVTNANGRISMPLAALSAMQVSIDPATNTFDVKGNYTLGAGGSTNPLTDNVTVQLRNQYGTASITIPGGSFQLVQGQYDFSGVVNGAPVEAVITPQGPATFSFSVSAAGVPNLPAANPINLTFITGNNAGTIPVAATITSPAGTAPAPTPIAPAPTPIAPAPTPTAPAPTPTAPAPTPTAPAPTPIAPAPTPIAPAPTLPPPPTL